MKCAYCTDEGRCLIDLLICDPEDCPACVGEEILEEEV